MDYWMEERKEILEAALSERITTDGRMDPARYAAEVHLVASAAAAFPEIKRNRCWKEDGRPDPERFAQLGGFLNFAGPNAGRAYAEPAASAVYERAH